MYIIGNPFFLIFHTLFDRENEKLHFNPENHKFIEKDPEKEEKDSEKDTKTEQINKEDKNNSNTLKIIIIILVVIIFIIGLVYCIYNFFKWQKSKREFEEQLRSSNFFDYNSDLL